MGYFRYNLVFLNSIAFTSSTYTELDNYLNGVVKNYLNHNYSFLQDPPTEQELEDLKSDILGNYNLMLDDVKPRYIEVLRLGTQQKFTSKDTTSSEYGNETRQGKYFEPMVNNTQAEIKTNGEVTSWEDDKVTLDKEEYRVLSESAIKDFFKEIKEEVENYFIDYVNTFGCDVLDKKCESFTQEQLDAINSGITKNNVLQINTNKENIQSISEILVVLDDSKQDKLNSTQLDAINSGIDATKVSQIETNKNNIIDINNKIPSQATITNKLADKDFVNSSIATNTANFIGTFNSLADLNAYSGTKTNNDYAFVIELDSQGNTVYNRYKWNGTQWLFEYALNNSSFTANQWNTINSGLTGIDKTKLDGIEAGAQVNTITSVNNKVGAVTLNADDVGGANLDASNLSSGNVNSWRNTLKPYMLNTYVSSNQYQQTVSMNDCSTLQQIVELQMANPYKQLSVGVGAADGSSSAKTLLGNPSGFGNYSYVYTTEFIYVGNPVVHMYCMGLYVGKLAEAYIWYDGTNYQWTGWKILK